MAKAERKRIIQGIVGSHAGVLGAEVCQLCGQLGSYSGWADATGSHFSGEFVPFGHGHVEPDDRQPDGWEAYGPTAFARLRELLAAREQRFCELCQLPVRRQDAHRSGRHWLCDPCVADRGEKEINPRRRYVELIVRDDNRLRTWGENLGVV